ncbi:hypothetical protein B0H63DRAFT_446989 [Podospora didyma]|uniref:Uncharacterized protein n=1 Tax=Podospora didyma TaxID=330526 RepID=A0AAE0P0B1_9PEZI|nr:hypothetical protein B0H63DRAFT_446989 [Podospora didyma]
MVQCVSCPSVTALRKTLVALAAGAGFPENREGAPKSATGVGSNLFAGEEECWLTHAYIWMQGERTVAKKPAEKVERLQERHTLPANATQNQPMPYVTALLHGHPPQGKTLRNGRHEAQYIRSATKASTNNTSRPSSLKLGAGAARGGKSYLGQPVTAVGLPAPRSSLHASAFVARAVTTHPLLNALASYDHRGKRRLNLPSLTRNQSDDSLRRDARSSSAEREDANGNAHQSPKAGMNKASQLARAPL